LQKLNQHERIFYIYIYIDVHQEKVKKKKKKLVKLRQGKNFIKNKNRGTKQEKENRKGN